MLFFLLSKHVNCTPTLQEIDPLHILYRYLSIVVGICSSGAQDFISSFKTCKLLTKKNDQIGTYLF